MRKIETLSKLLPIGGTLIMLCSSIKVVIYYKFFNISITDFLSIGEYVTLFIDDILYYLAIFGLGIFLNIVSPNEKKEEDSGTDNTDYTIFKNEKKWIVILSIITLILIIILFFYVNSTENKLNVVKVGLFGLLSFFYVYALKTKIKFNYFYYIISGLLIYTIMDGVIDAQKIFDNKNKLNYNITIENKMIETNDDFHYLGKSEKYLFFYSLKDQLSTIISIDDLNKITIVEKIKNGS